MDEFVSILLAIITTGGLGMVNYTIAESLDTVDSNSKNISKEKGITGLLTIVDLVIYLILDSLLRIKIHNNFAEIIAVIITVITSVIISIKLSKPISNHFYNLINKQRNSNGLISLDSGTPWQTVTLSKNKPQQVYLYSLDHNPLGCGWAQCVSNDSESNYSLSLVPFTDNEEKVQPAYKEVVTKIQAKEYKDTHIVQQYIDFKERFIMITSIEKD